MPLTDSNEADISDVSEYSYNRVCNTVSKVGYSAGITDGRESVFQTGFDCGYENGLLTGFELAKYKAFFGVIKKNGSPDDIHTESIIHENLNIPEATDKCHFKVLESTDKNTTEVFNQQLDYVNKQKGVLAKALPIVTNLFVQ